MTDETLPEMPRATENQQPAAPDAEVTKLSDHQKKIAFKAQQKVQQQVSKLLKRGVPSNQIAQELAKERWNNLSPDKKIQHLQMTMVQTLNGFAKDIIALRNNDQIIVEALEVNYRAICLALEIAGVPREKQAEILKLVEAELKEEKNRELEAEMQREKAAHEALKESEAKSEQQTMEEALMDKESPSAPAEAPADGVEFGGEG